MILRDEFKKQIKKVVSLGLMGTICTVSVFSVGALSRKVSIDVDGKVISAFTTNSDSRRILDQVGVDVSDIDNVEKVECSNGTLKIIVKRAFDVSVSKGDTKIYLKKSAGTVEQAIKESGLEIGDNDEVNYPLGMCLYAGMDIRITGRVNVEISVDGESKNYMVPSGNVSDALSYVGVSLSCNDVLNVDLNSQVNDGMHIVVDRVEFRESTKYEDIPFETEVKKSKLMNNNSRRVSTTGRNGKKEVVVREKLVNGVVVETVEVSSKVVSNPIKEVIVEGTNSASKAPSVNSVDESSATKVLSGSATAYTAPCGARTSTGAIPTQGVTVAVNPNKIPYGKKLTIKSKDGSFVWSGIAQDTGGALKKGTAIVDIFMNSKADCIKFGRKSVNVYVS